VAGRSTVTSFIWEWHQE